MEATFSALRRSVFLLRLVRNVAAERAKLAQLDAALMAPDAWSGAANTARSSRLSAEGSSTRTRIAAIDALADEAASLSELAATARMEESESDAASLLDDIAVSALELEARGDALWTSTVLARAAEEGFGGSDDGLDACYVEVVAGAGGDDSRDWVRMLLRMYSGWAAAAPSPLAAELVEADAASGDLAASSASGREWGSAVLGSGALLRSGTLRVVGASARVLLAGETGPHRLVRISPFDSAKRRHTSLAQVHVYSAAEGGAARGGAGRAGGAARGFAPSEVRVDTFRAQGAGGQHVNTTDSAVRMVHLASGLVAVAQSERSQHRNRATAEALLRAKLAARAGAARERARAARHAALGGRGFGQGETVRSYVLHPYTLAKQADGAQSSDVLGVLEGGDALGALLFARLEHTVLAHAASAEEAPEEAAAALDVG